MPRGRLKGVLNEGKDKPGGSIGSYRVGKRQGVTAKRAGLHSLAERQGARSIIPAGVFHDFYARLQSLKEMFFTPILVYIQMLFTCFLHVFKVSKFTISSVFDIFSFVFACKSIVFYNSCRFTTL